MESENQVPKPKQEAPKIMTFWEAYQKVQEIKRKLREQQDKLPPKQP